MTTLTSGEKNFYIKDQEVVIPVPPFGPQSKLVASLTGLEHLSCRSTLSACEHKVKQGLEKKLEETGFVFGLKPCSSIHFYF